MKHLDKTEFCLGLQLKHLPERMFVHQSTHTERWVLEKFNMGKYHPLKTPIVVQSKEVDKDQFRCKGDDDEVLGPKVPYLSTIGAQMYVGLRLDIEFALNLLARYNTILT